MAAGITDTLSRVTDSTTGRPIIASLASPGKAIGASSLNLSAATNWSTVAAIHFAIYETVTVAGVTVKDTSSQTDWKGVLAGTTITNLTLTGGTDRDYTAGALVEITPTSRYAKDLYDNISTHANQDGTLKTSAVQNALNISGTSDSGWVALATAPSLVATNGNRSFDLQYAGVDYTDRLSKGMRLKIPRTSTAPTQSADFNGTSQYASKASPSGYTWNTAITCEANVEIDAYATNNCIVSRRLAGTSGFELRVSSDGTVLLICFRAASNSRQVQSLQSVPLGRKTHIAASIDMATGTSAIYFDGVSVPVFASTTGTATTFTQGGSLQIGAYDSANDFLDGRLSQVRVWSAVRTATEIKNTMNGELTGAETNLASYWKLNGDFNDSTSNANHLTASGGATATYADNPFSSTAYAIVMSKPVYAAGNTTLTVQAANGYAIPNETLGTSSYSTVKNPYGFPIGNDKWEVLYFNPNTLTPGISITANNWANPASQQILIPVGDWSLKEELAIWNNVTGTAVVIMGSLSTSATAETDPRFTSGFFNQGASASMVASGLVSKTHPVSLSTATTYYGILSPGTVSSGNVRVNQNGVTSFAALPAGL